MFVGCSTAHNIIPLRLRAELALSAVNGLAYLHEMKVGAPLPATPPPSTPLERRCVPARGTEWLPLHEHY
jgi:hypothetical protein